MEKTVTIEGVIENVVYRNEDNDYSVIEIVNSENLLITAVGIIPMPSEGENVSLTGFWTYHKEFGKQFSFSSFEKFLPKEAEGILQYLSSRTVKGIGPVTALKIVNRFGENSFDVIENHPEWLADIPGITMKKAAAISESFREQSGIRGVMMFCSNFMSSQEVTRVYKKLGGGAVGIIKENPYVLCEGDFGISFEKADAIAKSLDISPDSEFRVLSALKYVLNSNGISSGHTALPYDKLLMEATGILGIERRRVSEMLSGFTSSKRLNLFKKGEEAFVMTNEVAAAETYIVNKLTLLSNRNEAFSKTDVALLLEKAEIDFGIEYADLQRKAIFEAALSGVMILTGGPGTGKTTVVKALLNIFKSIGLKTVLCAPTGRAAKRMSEATSSEAKTIHRMLEMEKGEFSRVRFERNSNNPLDEDVIIVDEASMIDLFLFEALLLAMKRSAKLILIGDVDQLPSVGAGNVFSDLINSGVLNTIKLNEIFRQSRESLIITNAHKINNGETPVLNVVDKDFFFVKRETESDIPQTISALITERLPKTYGEGIRDDIQVITPSKKGAAGVEILNSVLRDTINPASKYKKEKLSHGVIFREGDKVMQTTNNYEIEWQRGSKHGLGVFNGDIGIIKEINLQDETVEIHFEDKVALYTFDLLEEIDLAYSITVHKSQGSEYPVVIIPLYYCNPMLQTRNLFYTAVTRAKKMVILVGRYDIPSKMVSNNRKILRYTTLKERILKNAEF